MKFRRREKLLITAIGASALIGYLLKLPKQQGKKEEKPEKKGLTKLTKLTVNSYECKVEYEKQGENYKFTIRELGKHDINGKYEPVSYMKIEPFLCDDKDKGLDKIVQQIMHWKPLS